MTQLTQDVNPNDAPSSPAPALEPGTPPSEAENPNAASNVSEAIPYERFNQVNQQKNEAQAQAEQLAKDKAALQFQLLQVANQVKQQQQQPQPSTTSTAQPAEMDADEAYIRQHLGEDETGQRTYDVLERHFNRKTTQAGLVTRDEAAQLAQEAANATMGKINSTFQATNTLQQWVGQGMLTTAEAQQLNADLAETLQRNPQTAHNPANVGHLLNTLYVGKVEKGEIRPLMEPPRPNNPLQPGGGAPPPAPPPVYDAANSPFQRLRGLDTNRVEELARTSESNARMGNQ